MDTGAIAALAFWGFVTAVSVGGIITPYLRHRETQRTIRALAQSGQSIDPDTLERLIDRAKGPEIEVRGPDNLGRKLLLPATILIALGPGMAILGFFVSLQANQTIYALYGVGALLFCLGAGMMSYAIWMIRTTAPERFGPGQ